jgi:gas vesicle protein
MEKGALFLASDTGYKKSTLAKTQVTAAAKSAIKDFSNTTKALLKDVKDKVKSVSTLDDFNNFLQTQITKLKDALKTAKNSMSVEIRKAKRAAKEVQLGKLLINTD